MMDGEAFQNRSRLPWIIIFGVIMVLLFLAYQVSYVIRAGGEIYQLHYRISELKHQEASLETLKESYRNMRQEIKLPAADSLLTGGDLPVLMLGMMFREYQVELRGVEFLSSNRHGEERSCIYRIAFKTHFVRLFPLLEEIENRNLYVSGLELFSDAATSGSDKIDCIIRVTFPM